MTNDRELLQQALDVMLAAIKAGDWKVDGACDPDYVLEALRARLAQPEPEPVAWKDAPSKIYLQVCDESDCDQPFDSHIEVSWCQDKINDSDIAYIRADTASPQREWQGLTDEEMEEAMKYWSDPCRSAYGGAEAADDEYVNMIGTWRYIEAKLKEKNT